MSMKKFFSILSFTLVIVGALNWGLVGLLETDLIHYLFSEVPLLMKTVYLLVGLAGFAALTLYKKLTD